KAWRIRKSQPCSAFRSRTFERTCIWLASGSAGGWRSMSERSMKHEQDHPGSDDELDRWLAEARWPAVAAESSRRLQRRWGELRAAPARAWIGPRLAAA